MTINERFQTIIECLYNGNKRAFATAVGISPTVVENVVGTRKGKPSYEVLVKVCANANISEAWLISGIGAMLKEQDTESSAEYHSDQEFTSIGLELEKSDPTSGFSNTSPKIPLNDTPESIIDEDINPDGGQGYPLISRKHNSNPYKPFERLMNPPAEPEGIPFVSVRAVGGFAGKDFSIQKQDIEAYYVVPKFRNLNVDFLIEVIGDSMMPRIFPGDIIACSIIRNPQFIQWNKPYLISSEEQGMIVKRLKKSKENDCFLAVSDNPDYDPFDIPKTDIQGLARVVGVIHAE